MDPQRAHAISLKPATIIAAAVLLLLVGILAMVYQFRSAHAERERQLTAQANTLAASVTAAISFNDHAAAREYVRALMLDPSVDAVAIYNETGRLVVDDQRPGSKPISAMPGNGQRRTAAAGSMLLVGVPAHQGTTMIGSVWLRGTAMPWAVRLARISGVALLTVMAVLMLTVLAVAQRALTRTHADLHRRAEELAESNARLTAEMEQRSRAEEALRQSQKMEAVGQLSGGIAHDFNNVLMVVKSAFALLEKRLTEDDAAVARFAQAARDRIAVGAQQEDAESLRVLESGLQLAAQGKSRRRQIRHYLETAHEGIDKAADLTRRLLGFARQQPLLPRSVQLDALIRGMRPLLEHSGASNMHIHYRLDSRWHVSCDANQMENAILNLVINARDAMPNGGDITISTLDVHADPNSASVQAMHDHVRLRVADTGTGMSGDVRSKALDPFFTTKPVGKGTGLGLSTVLGYILQSDGRLDIESEVGVGTTIDIRLPRELDTVSTQVT